MIWHTSSSPPFLKTEQAAKGIPHLLDVDSSSAPDQGPRDPLSLRLPPAPPLASSLLAAQSEAAALWAGVEGHLRRFADLPKLVDGVVGSEVHPYAIDGGKLRALAGLGPSAADSSGDAAAGAAAPGSATPTAAGSAAAAAAGSGEADIIAMLEGWVDRLEALEGQISQLDGANTGQPTPLLATADTRSHAPHLFAQLGLHQTCLQGMRELEVDLEDELAATGDCGQCAVWKL